jgi:pectin methylesterase-like acyl-CoA thioesterase
MRLRLPILIGVVCAAPIVAFGQDHQEGQGNGALFVPSNQYPTIQSAINAAPDRGVIKIAGGLFTEALVIQGKSITLQGSADPQFPTEIRVTDQVSPVVTFAFGEVAVFAA